MIHYVTGNLLDAPAQALVNTVNTVGVMGKGIALQFREAYPENYKAYRQACAEHQLAPGQLLVVREKNLQGEKTIVNFPTKTEWFQPSRYEWIEAGLKALLQAIAEHKIQSIALPPLGCGNGKLEWSKVKPLMERYLSDLDIEVLIYAPNEAVKSVLQAQEQSSRAQLTPARAMLLYGLYHYESMGENSSLFVANKLAWFLQRLGEPLRLTFKAHHYGPYSVQVGHVLYALNGSYLRGLEQNSARPFDPLQLDYASFEAVKNYVDTQLDTAQRQRLDSLLALIEGFQSAWSLEVLASVDFLMKEKPGIPTDALLTDIQNWNERKKKLARPGHIIAAQQRLEQYSNQLSFTPPR